MSETNHNKKDRFCRKCLLREMMDKMDLYGSIKEYVEQLDEEVKATKEEYEKRLNICKECDKLTEAMCKGCGCFVEMRAAVYKNTCPYEKW